MHLYRPYTVIWENVETSYLDISSKEYDPVELKLDEGRLVDTK